MIEVGREGGDLRRRQAVGDRFHDQRWARLRPILASLFAPVQQVFLQRNHGAGQLSGTVSLTLGVRAMAHRTGFDIGFGNALFVELLADGHEVLWSTLRGLGIETL